MIEVFQDSPKHIPCNIVDEAILHHLVYQIYHHICNILFITTVWPDFFYEQYHVFIGRSCAEWSLHHKGVILDLIFVFVLWLCIIGRICNCETPYMYIFPTHSAFKVLKLITSMSFQKRTLFHLKLYNKYEPPWIMMDVPCCTLPPKKKRLKADIFVPSGPGARFPGFQSRPLNRKRGWWWLMKVLGWEFRWGLAPPQMDDKGYELFIKELASVRVFFFLCMTLAFCWGGKLCLISVYHIFSQKLPNTRWSVSKLCRFTPVLFMNQSSSIWMHYAIWYYHNIINVKSGPWLSYRWKWDIVFNDTWCKNLVSSDAKIWLVCVWV